MFIFPHQKSFFSIALFPLFFFLRFVSTLWLVGKGRERSINKLKSWVFNCSWRFSVQERQWGSRKDRVVGGERGEKRGRERTWRGEERNAKLNERDEFYERFLSSFFFFYLHLFFPLSSSFHQGFPAYLFSFSVSSVFSFVHPISLLLLFSFFLFPSFSFRTFPLRGASKIG